MKWVRQAMRENINNSEIKSEIINMADLQQEPIKRGAREVKSGAGRTRKCPIAHIQDIRRLEAVHEDWFLEEEAPCPLLSTLESVLDFDLVKLEPNVGTRKKSKDEGGLRADVPDGLSLDRDPQKMVRKIAEEVEFYVYIEPKNEPERSESEEKLRGSHVWLEDLTQFAEGTR